MNREELGNLTPFHLYVLLHLKRAGVDYVKMMAKMTGLDQGLLQDAVDDLMEMGLVERDSGSAIKRSRARFKKAFEVHKHHTYYRLSREGQLLVRDIDAGWVRRYFSNLLGPGAFELLKCLSERSEVSRCGVRIDEKSREDLVLYRLMTPSGRRTKFLGVLLRFLPGR
ncbi:MAG: DUF2250 domain-containing protein [Thermococci archaeon]|nr:DUF2250 domain-containing protein [Thermococci archaeon]